MGVKVNKDDFELAQIGGTGIQIKYVEQWLNDVIKDAVSLGMPGVMQKPEHKKPLDRYEIDRSNLGNNNVPTENIDSIYRALYVHSVGFYK